MSSRQQTNKGAALPPHKLAARRYILVLFGPPSKNTPGYPRGNQGYYWRARCYLFVSQYFPPFARVSLPLPPLSFSQLIHLTPSNANPTQSNPTHSIKYQPNPTQLTHQIPTQPNPTPPNPTQPNPTQPNPTLGCQHVVL